MAFKKWLIGHPDRERAKKISEELDIDPFTALMLLGRGITEIDAIEYFLTDEPVLANPRDLADISKAADCINEAINTNIKIAVYGDYDCDGIAATAIMYKYLKSRNADVMIYIPDRLTEGYGMNRKAVDYLKAQGVEFIITVDNGIASVDEIAYAASLGIVTVVTDHHLPAECLPDAAAIVNPHRSDDYSSFKEICGAFVAFKVICVCDDKEPEELIFEYSDLVAVATVGDVMPLVDENRSIVKFGMNCIKQNSNTGLSALLSVSGVERDSVDCQKLAFTIVPRLNAAGRMGSVKRAFELIVNDKITTAISIANEIENDNALRQKTEKEIFGSAVKIIEDSGYNYDRVIVVSGENYHLGVVGIVAARITEKYGKPAIVLSSEGEIAHGSGRSISGFNIFEAIKNSSEYLIRFGGHELAAGISLKSENIDSFRISVNNFARSINPAIPTLNLDFKINPKMLTADMVYAVKMLEPFGNANPVPVFGIFGLTIQKITPIGQGKHLRIMFGRDDFSFQALLFGVTEENFCFKNEDTVDIAVNLEINNYKGITSLSVIVKSIRPSGVNDDEVFKDKFALDDYFSGNSDLPLIKGISRENIGSIYRYVTLGKKSREQVIYRFLNTFGVAATELSLAVLKELDLIEEKSGILYIGKTEEKKDLLNSKIYSEAVRKGGIE